MISTLKKMPWYMSEQITGPFEFSFSDYQHSEGDSVDSVMMTATLVTIIILLLLADNPEERAQIERELEQRNHWEDSVPMDPIETFRVALSTRDYTLPRVILNSLEVKKPDAASWLARSWRSGSQERHERYFSSFKGG
ncbi:hypothetical protein QBC43DRAFT_297864 [Cladorrhinum sp. PSN259]|nr:hypothetical protein QBC43DRAFT_297864 [Cladorrhinum sp. PSN259]